MDIKLSNQRLDSSNIFHGLWRLQSTGTLCAIKNNNIYIVVPLSTGPAGTLIVKDALTAPKWLCKFDVWQEFEIIEIANEKIVYKCKYPYPNVMKIFTKVKFND